jgi:hypothetical protein
MLLAWPVSPAAPHGVIPIFSIAPQTVAFPPRHRNTLTSPLLKGVGKTNWKNCNQEAIGLLLRSHDKEIFMIYRSQRKKKWIQSFFLKKM